ncbi:MAG TPA: hypothetical protein VN694_07185 [Caulobacteraceae bacterium]|nr:hypothetical protein [Caulobacteraceae bacterium]
MSNEPAAQSRRTEIATGIAIVTRVTRARLGHRHEHDTLPTAGATGYAAWAEKTLEGAWRRLAAQSKFLTTARHGAVALSGDSLFAALGDR